MKKTITTAFALLVGAAVSLNAQNRYAATPLNFTNSSSIAHEFGFSSAEFNGYTILGTEFNDHINVYKGGFFLFQATTPIPHEYPTFGFGHALAMNQDWVAAGTLLDNSVYLSKNVNGVPQKDFNTILKPLSSNTYDRYGSSLDIYGDWMVVGAPSNPNAASNTRGYIELWKQNASGWTRTQKIQPSTLPVDNLFGCAVAMYGDYLVVGATGAKKILLYKQTNGVWNLIDSYSPDFATWNGPAAYNASTGINYSKFGWDVEIYKDKIIVGDPGTIQKAAILSIVGDKLVFTKTLLPPGYSTVTPTYYGDFGHSVAIGIERAVVGAPYSYGSAISFRQEEGKAFFYGKNWDYINYMYAGNVAGTEVRGLGRSVTIEGEIVVVGAEYSNHTATARPNEGTGFRMPFYYISKVGNTPPNVSVKSIASSTNFIAPGNIFIRTNTLDVDGSVSKVEYWEGTKLLATSVITPHEFNYTDVSAGIHTITIEAYDNLGGMDTAIAQFVVNPAPLNNVSPTVVLTNPVKTKIYNRDAPITMVAVPSDVDGTISSVHFYDYETEIGVATKAPYTCVWKAVGGTHALKAVAFDNKGAFGLSYVNVTVNSGVMCGAPAWNATTNYKVGDVVSLNNYLFTCIAPNVNVNFSSQSSANYWKGGNACPGVNILPKVSITSPLNNSTVFRTDTAFITATTSDVDGDVSKVEFFANGNKCGERTSSPYNISFPISSGQFDFVAKATDNEGGVSYSWVTVDYNKPPTVSITNPVANKKYNTGALITISANAADVDGSILEVDFLVDNQLVGVVLKAPYTFVWKATPGTHAIKAVAYDDKNKSTQSAIVNISANALFNCSAPAWNATTSYLPGDVISNNNFYYTCIANNFNVNPSTQASIGFWKGNACAQVNQAPTAVITSPLTNTSYFKPSTTTLTASASDADGDISKVVFYRDGLVVAEKTSSPYTVTFPAKAGVSFYYAVAIDNEGRSGRSDYVYLYSNFTDGCTAFPYDAYKYYPAGSLISLNGNIYKANVATQNQTPIFYTEVGKPWILVGTCGASFKTDAAEISAVVETVSNVLSLYPNPSNGMVMVKLEMQEQSNVTLKVINVTGAEVAQRNYTATSLINEEMNLSHLSSGLYFVHVLVNDQLRVEKLVIE